MWKKKPVVCSQPLWARHGSEEAKEMNNRRKQYPDKTSVNLLYRDKANELTPRMLVAVAVFVVALALFCKFAVIDRLWAADRALREAEEMEKIVATLQQGNSDYEEVLREYQHYYFSVTDTGNGEPVAYVDCLEVLGLLESELLNRAGVQMVNLTGSVLTVNLTEINLEDASAIAKSLMKHKMVKDVTVSTANRHQELEGTKVYLIIVLETEDDEAAEQDVDAEEGE